MTRKRPVPRPPFQKLVSEIEVLKARAANGTIRAEVERLQAELRAVEVRKDMEHETATGDLRRRNLELEGLLAAKTAEGFEAVGNWVLEYSRQAEIARMKLEDDNKGLRLLVEHLRQTIADAPRDTTALVEARSQVEHLEVALATAENEVDVLKRTGWAPEWVMGLFLQWRNARTGEERTRYANRLVQRCLAMARSQQTYHGANGADIEAALVVRGFNDTQVEQLSQIVDHLRRGGGITLTDPPPVEEPKAEEPQPAPEESVVSVENP